MIDKLGIPSKAPNTPRTMAISPQGMDRSSFYETLSGLVGNRKTAPRTCPPTNTTGKNRTFMTAFPTGFHLTSLAGTGFSHNTSAKNDHPVDMRPSPKTSRGHLPDAVLTAAHRIEIKDPRFDPGHAPSSLLRWTVWHRIVKGGFMLPRSCGKNGRYGPPPKAASAGKMSRPFCGTSPPVSAEPDHRP